MGFVAFFRLILLSWPMLMWARRRFGLRLFSRPGPRRHASPR